MTDTIQFMCHEKNYISHLKYLQNFLERPNKAKKKPEKQDQNLDPKRNTDKTK